MDPRIKSGGDEFLGVVIAILSKSHAQISAPGTPVQTWKQGLRGAERRPLRNF